MPKFAEIAFPTAVRQLYTYQLTLDQQKDIRVGMRVWAPLRNYNAIGVVVKLHDEKPTFQTKEIRQILDKEPILDNEILKLTQWIHRFYYSSLGEVIQAALPAGLNFVSKKYIRVANTNQEHSLTELQKEVLGEIKKQTNFEFNEAKKRWVGTSANKALNELLKLGAIEIWEEPDLKVTVKTERAWDWADGRTTESAKAFLEETKSKGTKWKDALEFFAEKELPIRNSELATSERVNYYSLNKLKEKGWIQPFEMEALPEKSPLDFDPNSIKSLNKEQSKAFSVIQTGLEKGEFANYLLYGITGSGKTEVYIHALKQVVESGKGGIVLVPEIALTPQTVSRFYKIFGEEVAVLHSRMTSRERLLAWNDLKSGTKKIAIGPRSAVFAPVQNLGLIILDEEHDASYKQIDPAPRYHARETAIMRANLNKAVVIMGSATPSMQALSMAAKGKCKLLELKERHAEATLPEVQIIDLKQYKGAMKGDLSMALYTAIEDALSKKEQIILLYNRRGFANYLQCEDCGHIPQSPECSVSLTYHKRKNMLLCHYSGYSRRADTHCENCGSENLVIQGSGTQKVEEELAELFPEARLLRFDRDSTTRKGAHAKILNTFGEGEADIMVGTQLVAKGLDFPNVTVVGVIDADTELAFPSFQSTERMYQLLSQVSGRSGRGEKLGKVYIQTRAPENSAIQFAKRHDHEGFSKEEMGFRKPLNYPPYSRLIQFVLKGKEDNEVSNSAHLLVDVINRVVPDLDTLGPSPSAISWMNRNYFWEVMVKISPEKGDNYIEKLLDKVMEVYRYETPISEAKVRININVDSIR